MSTCAKTAVSSTPAARSTAAWPTAGTTAPWALSSRTTSKRPGEIVKDDDFLTIGKWFIENDHDYDCTVICYGQNVNRVRSYFEDKDIKIRLVDALFIKPMDFEMLNHIVDDKPFTNC